MTLTDTTPAAFIPTADDMQEARYGVLMTCLDDEDVIAVTGDRRRAIAALNWYTRTVADTILACPAVTTAAIDRHLSVQRVVFYRPQPGRPEWAWRFEEAPDHPQAVEVTVLAATSHICDPDCANPEAATGLPYDLPEAPLW